MPEFTKKKTLTLTDTIARPANTTDYAAGDVVSEVTTNDFFTFTRSASSDLPIKGTLNTAKMMILANQATKPDLELWLFSQTIAEVADNSAFAPTDVEILTLIDVIPFALADWYVGLAGAGADGNIVQVKNNLAIPIPSTNGNIYGQLVVRNVYTPISGESFTAKLLIDEDRV